MVTMRPGFGYEEATDTPLIEMGIVAAGLADTVDVVTFTAHRLGIRGPRHFFTGLHFWRLLLTFTNVDDPSYEVIGGFVDVLAVDLAKPDLDDRVSLTLLHHLHYPSAGEVFADLLGDDDQLNEMARLAGTDAELTHIIAVLNVFVDECLRGHRFGAALLSAVHQQFGGPTAVIGGQLPDGFSSLAGYWEDHLSAARTPEGLLVLPCSYAGADTQPPSPSDVLGQDFIKVDATTLRTRYAADDATLVVTRDGRDEIDDEDDDDDDEAAVHSVAQAAEAVEIAVGAITNVSDPDITCEVVAVLKFFTCSGADGSEPWEVFARAADYLSDHPELAVVSTHWNSTPCDSDLGEHMTLDVTVRRDD